MNDNLRIKLCSVLAAGVLCWTAQAADAPKAKAAPGAAHSMANSIPAPLSLADVMRASLEIAADGIWAAEGADKLSEEDWLLADEDSVNLLVAASLVSGAGTGKNDKQWAANADYQAWAHDMLKTALEIRGAVKVQDIKTMSAAADHLQEICEGCHNKYRPQTPTDGVSRYPFYPKRELAK